MTNLFTAFETQVDQYIHRLLVEEDAHHLEENNGELYDASSEAGKKLYQRGDFAESNITNLDSYLLSKVIGQLCELRFSTDSAKSVVTFYCCLSGWAVSRCFRA